MTPLTAVQAKLLTFIKAYKVENGDMSPTFVEMANAIGLRSKSGVHRLVNGLEERGHVILTPNRARSIEIVEPKLEVYRKALVLISKLPSVSLDDHKIIAEKALHG